MQDIVGIGGIVATVVVGIASCFVTWIVTKKSQKVMKLSWNAKTSKVLNVGPEFEKGKIQLLFDGNTINNPYMLQIRIKNMGNASIPLPIIKVRISNGGRIIPTGFINIPYGYEDKWTIKMLNEKEYGIELEYINAKQEITAVFYADGEVSSVDVSCPMRDVVVQEDDRLGETDESRIDRITSIILKILLAIPAIVLSIHIIVSSI